MPTDPVEPAATVLPTTTVADIPVVAAPIAAAPIAAAPIVAAPVLAAPVATLPVAAAPAPAASALTAANPTVSGTASTVEVTVPNTSGTVTFQLVVTDNLGNQSAPATVTVTIQGAPVAKINATPNPVAAGRAITLSADGSTAAAPGTISKFTFTVENPT